YALPISAHAAPAAHDRTPQQLQAEGTIAPEALREEDTADSLIEQLHRAGEDLAAAIRAADLDTRGPVPDQPWFEGRSTWSMRWVALHLIEENARHAGHADILRESIDGKGAYELNALADGQPWPPAGWCARRGPSSDARTGVMTICTNPQGTRGERHEQHRDRLDPAEPRHRGRPAHRAAGPDRVAPARAAAPAARGAHRRGVLLRPLRHGSGLDRASAHPGGGAAAHLDPGRLRSDGDRLRRPQIGRAH